MSNSVGFEQISASTPKMTLEQFHPPLSAKIPLLCFFLGKFVLIPLTLATIDLFSVPLVEIKAIFLHYQNFVFY
jgi:hypothetical protein